MAFSQLTQKRLRRFKRNSLAYFSFRLLAVFLFFGLTAELWVGGSPHILYYQNRLYVPLLFKYHPTEFGRGDIFVMDYKSLVQGQDDWDFWPVVRWGPNESNRKVSSFPSPPSWSNWLGTDEVGRDVLARLIFGFRYTMLYSLGVWAISYIIGSLAGACMGYYGGFLDLIGMRFIELFESVPIFFILITINSVFNPNIALLIILSSLFNWTLICTHVRGQFLSIRKRDYVEAARAMGANDSRIIFKHIFPNALTPIVTFAPFSIAANVYYLSMMDYLGLGLPAPTPSWGDLIAQSQKWFATAEWLVWSPSVAMLLTLSLLILIGQGVRDAFDEKS